MALGVPPDVREIVMRVCARHDVLDACRRRDLGTVITILGAHGLTQGKLAILTGITQGRLSEYKTGKRVPRASSTFEAFADGCGSFEVSWLRCEDVGFAVFRVVDAFVFSAEVVAPVGVEVAAGGEGTELEDGLGSFQAPSRACYVHSVLYDVAACSFDDSGGDRPALGEGRRIAQVVLLVFQVAGAFVGAGALLRGVAAGGGAAPDPGGGLAGLAVQDLAGLACNPFLSGGLAFVEEGPGRLPEVLKYVDEVDDDRDGDAAARGLGGHGLDLGVVAVHEDGPFPPAARVAAFGLAEGH